MQFKNTLVALCLILLSGCAAAVGSVDYYDVDTETLKRIKPLLIVDEQAVQSSDYKELDAVSGMHCKRTRLTDGYGGAMAAAERTAIDQVKLRAAGKGATHITSPECVINETMDLVNNCWASIKCTSTAMKMQAQSQ